MTPTYTVKTLGDLHQIPADRRRQFLKEFLYVLAFNELLFGEGAKAATDEGTEWTDDGDLSVSIRDTAGADAFVLQINKEPAAAPARAATTKERSNVITPSVGRKVWFFAQHRHYRWMPYQQNQAKAAQFMAAGLAVGNALPNA